MLQKYFGIYLEFNHELFFQKLNSRIETGIPGYVCVVDANVLNLTQKNKDYQNVINDAFLNSCDGSSIALLASLIHKKKFLALNGPNIFNNLLLSIKHKHLLVGNTTNTFLKIQHKMKQDGLDISLINHLDLPFLAIEDFDYIRIANEINVLRPDFIWVSLGAPKQEYFMHNILPHLNSGVMIGIGAALNFYIGDIKMSNFSIFGLRFIWVNRIIKDPFRLSKRLLPYFISIPKLFYSEYKKIKNEKQEEYFD